MSWRAFPPGVSEDRFAARHLHRPVWKLRLQADTDLGEVVAQARGVSALVCARCDADDSRAAAALRSAGFRAVGRLITFRSEIAGDELRPGSQAVREAVPGDATRCTEIAASAFRTDRFHADSMVPDAHADALKAAWTANAFNGRADRILVAQHENQVAGFTLCLWRPPVAVIDLIGVAARARGRGLGLALIEAVRFSAGSQGLEAIEAGTQETNAPACALYRRCGFTATRQALDFHWTS